LAKNTLLIFCFEENQFVINFKRLVNKKIMTEYEIVLGRGILKYSVNHCGIIVMQKNSIVEIVKIEDNDYLIKCPTAIEPDYLAYVQKEVVELIMPINRMIN
jgi:hypothetical protein